MNPKFFGIWLCTNLRPWLGLPVFHTGFPTNTPIIPAWNQVDCIVQNSPSQQLYLLCWRRAKNELLLQSCSTRPSAKKAFPCATTEGTEAKWFAFCIRHWKCWQWDTLPRHCPCFKKVAETVHKMFTKTAEGSNWLRETAEAPVYQRKYEMGLEHGIWIAAWGENIGPWKTLWSSRAIVRLQRRET